jgi:FkbM family methyltransferase
VAVARPPLEPSSEIGVALNSGHRDNAAVMTTKLRYLYRAYRYRYRVDPAEVRFLCSRLQRDQVAVDIGCHKGAYTYWMRRRVGARGSVFAFEPQPRQIAYLREVFSAMCYDNVSIVPMAVSDTSGSLPLYVPCGSSHGASLEARSEHETDPRSSLLAPRSLYVDATTLDAFFADRPHGPDFVKIDVEGHELAVLRGALQTLTSHRPTILVECEARHRPDGDVRPVFELLESLGFEGSFFSNGRRRPLAEFNPAVHQRIDPVENGLPRGYANNFAFEPGA